MRSRPPAPPLPRTSKLQLPPSSDVEITVKHAIPGDFISAWIILHSPLTVNFWLAVGNFSGLSRRQTSACRPLSSSPSVGFMLLISGVPGSALRTFVSGRRVCPMLLETRAHNKNAIDNLVMIAPVGSCECGDLCGFYRNIGRGQSNLSASGPAVSERIRQFGSG